MNEIDKIQLWKIKAYINQKIEKLEKERAAKQGGAKMLITRKILELEEVLKELK